MIDQTLLPGELKILEITDHKIIAEAIKSLRIRGAPAIGIAGAYGLVLAANQYEGKNLDEFMVYIRDAAGDLISTRPTAINLSWAITKLLSKIEEKSLTDIDEIRSALLKEANSILEADLISCKKMGKYGAALLPDSATGLTHCNAGGLATGSYGTALGVIFSAVESGKNIKMYADETRPLLQGARLTT